MTVVARGIDFSDSLSRLLDIDPDATGQHRGLILRSRAKQLEAFLSLADVCLTNTRILEIGGGLSGQAFHLRSLAGQVISIDLLSDSDTYGGNTTQWRTLQSSDPDRLLNYVCARAEAIPLQDESVDVVFSFFVLEHIHERALVLSEISRVLRPGGLLLIAVPNVMEPVFRGLGFLALELPRRLARTVTNGIRSSSSTKNTWFHDLRECLWYPPHGEYKTRAREILASRPVVWDALIVRSGLTVTDRFSISFEDYGSFLIPSLRRWWRLRLVPIIRRIGKAPLAIRLGTSYCIVAQKAKEQNTKIQDPHRGATQAL